MSIEGAVYLPGLYSLSSVTTIGALLEASKGLTLDAFPARATLYRRNYEIESEARSVDLQNPSDLSIILRGGDRLYIPSSKDLLDFGQVSISGQVQSPGSYPFREGMRISDLLLLGDGLKVNANSSAITLYRMDLNSEGTTSNTTISLDENLVPSNNLLLEPDDYVVVRTKSGYQTIETVTLNGEVKNRGVYVLKDKNYSLYDLMKDAGGFLDEANLKGITVTRSIVQAETNQKALAAAATNNTSEAGIAGLLSGLSGDRVVIGIDGEKLMSSGGLDQKNNIILKEGDEVYVSKLDNTISVVGTVQQNSKQIYRNGLTVKQVINNSGGYGERPNRKNVYVVYQNGSIKKRGHFLDYVLIQNLSQELQ